MVKSPFICLLYYHLFTSEHLVDKHFDMVLSELLWGDYDLVEVTLHQWRHYVAGGGRRREEEGGGERVITSCPHTQSDATLYYPRLKSPPPPPPPPPSFHLHKVLITETSSLEREASKLLHVLCTLSTSWNSSTDKQNNNRQEEQQTSRTTTMTHHISVKGGPHSLLAATAHTQHHMAKQVNSLSNHVNSLSTRRVHIVSVLVIIKWSLPVAACLKEFGKYSHSHTRVFLILFQC